MCILALETSSLYGSVAILDVDGDGPAITELRLRQDQRSAQSLAPAIQQVLQQAQRPLRDVKLIAVAVGPGSFTGLRVGVTMAKTLAYACQAEVLGVNTLEAIAFQAPLEQGLVTAVMDAQRHQLFAATFRKDGETVVETSPTQIVDGDHWESSLEAGSSVTGTGLRRSPLQRSDLKLVDESHWAPLASTVGRLAQAKFSQGARTTCWELMPQYFRKSAAEEKLQP